MGKVANLYFTKSGKRSKPGKRVKINNNKRCKQKHLDFNIVMEFKVFKDEPSRNDV